MIEFKEEKRKNEFDIKCSAQGCERRVKYLKRKLCGMHYNRFKRTGHTDLSRKRKDPHRVDYYNDNKELVNSVLMCNQFLMRKINQYG